MRMKGGAGMGREVGEEMSVWKGEGGYAPYISPYSASMAPTCSLKAQMYGALPIHNMYAKSGS